MIERREWTHFVTATGASVKTQALTWMRIALSIFDYACLARTRAQRRREFFPRRLSRNSPCSPNRFQNHHGALKRSGVPQALKATARSILAPVTSHRTTKSLMVQKWMLGDSHHA